MSLAHELALALRTAYLSMHRQTNAFLCSFGITADQFVLLGVLVHQDDITQQEISRRASSDPNTVGAMLVLLEKKALVNRSPHKADRRALAITLTAKGRRLYTEIIQQIKLLHEILQGPFDPTELQALIAYLGRITEAMTNCSEKSDADPGVKNAMSKERT